MQNPPTNPQPPSAAQSWFESVWAHREESLYTSWLIDLGPGIFPIPASTFASLQHPNPDPRFLTHGVFECPPAPTRTLAPDHFIYITSGMSNAWGADPATVNSQEFSGLGYELTFHSPTQNRSLIQILHWVMAVQLLIATGHLQGQLLEPHDRIPLGGALPGRQPPAPGLTHLLALPPDASLPYPPRFQLASGLVDLLLLVGITTRENDFAKSQGPEALTQLLTHHQILPHTLPARLSTL